MKIVAKCPVEVAGHIYSKGEECEWTGIVTQRIADNFRGADGEVLAVSKPDAIGGDDVPAAPEKPDPEAERKAKIDKTVQVLRRNGIMQALDGMGVTYSPHAKTESLAKLLLMSKGEIVEE